MDAREARDELVALIGRYAERMTDPRSRETADRFLAFIRRRDDCFSRSCAEGHVTGSAFVTNPDYAKTLLVLHGKLGRWLQPGGHYEPGESALEAARREALEETGLDGSPALGGELFDLDIHEIPARGEAPAHLHYDARFLLVSPELAPELSDESGDVAWFGLEEAVAMNPEESMRRPLARLATMRSEEGRS
jgi:8-oxo-dGTP pyrophosphatase MutT (NUDIX family)